MPPGCPVLDMMSIDEAFVVAAALYRLGSNAHGICCAPKSSPKRAIRVSGSTYN